MRWAPWTDHLPLWVALGAAASTGIYEPGELAVMALPLAAAAGVEALRLDLGRHQRWLEVAALAFFLGDLARGRGVFPVAIHTLFVLAGVRLVLPRTSTHRRQLVLMGFLLFLTTAVSTTDLVFVAWALAWLAAAALTLLQQTWETSAALKRTAAAPPPYARVPLWTGAALALGAAFFLVLPRVNAGFRPPAILGSAATLARSGLGDQLELGGSGPIVPNPEVVLRIAPPPQTPPAALAGLDLLPGVVLEAFEDGRWIPSELTPEGALFTLRRIRSDQRAEFLFTPTQQGILTLPYGTTSLAPVGLPLRRGEGASLRWREARLRPVPLEATWDPRASLPREPALPAARLEGLLHLGSEEDLARRWSLRLAPGILVTPDLAQALERALRGFRYTLDNPSGRAERPLEDFLERTQAGHCEYFASAMALMLRARGVPARVVNGYRLGPWIPEGGYFRVSQDLAHSWVEYWHEGRWHRADPTPPAPAGTGGGTLAFGALSRWLDALRYQWDRHVVRFSDQDQVAAFAWAQAQWQGWEWRWRAPRPGTLAGLALAALAWTAWRTRRLWRRPPEVPGRIRTLRPLLARTRATAAPRPGETARAWLARLGVLRPERAAALAVLADAVDAEAYGGRTASAAALAGAEAAAWRGWKPPTSR